MKPTATSLVPAADERARAGLTNSAPGQTSRGSGGRWAVPRGAVPAPGPRCTYHMRTGNQKKNPALLTSRRQAAHSRQGGTCLGPLWLGVPAHGEWASTRLLLSPEEQLPLLPGGARTSPLAPPSTEGVGVPLSADGGRDFPRACRDLGTLRGSHLEHQVGGAPHYTRGTV